MTKDVWISIKGLQFEGAADAESIEVIQKGQFYKKNGAYYLMYEEPVEGSTKVIKNVIKFRENEVQVSKKGAINACLNFVEEKKNLSNYSTPYGNLMVGIDTQNIEIDEKKDSLTLNIFYALDVNYEFLADCKISVEARSILN